MLIEAVYHRPKLNWGYPYDLKTIHLRLRTKKQDVKEVWALAGDKYMWEKSKERVQMHVFATDDWFDYWECEVVPPFRRIKYGFLLKNDDEEIWMDEDKFGKEEPKMDRLFDIPFINPVDVFTPPAWVKDAVFYQIFPERFANGDPSINPKDTLPWGEKPEWFNFFGGDLQGIIDHLDHLTDLGINAIYMTPIFKATTNHKYDTEDYMELDPHFGDKETLKKLIATCHDKGIRVMFDAVFNHSGKTFAPFVDVQEKGEQSKYKDWFHVRKFPLAVEDGIPTYDTFDFEPLMPKLNTENPEVKEYLLNVAKYWVEEFGIDGWRLDVADEVDHHFWREFRQTVKSINPDVYILGEIWHESSPWLQGDQFDAVMNYPFKNAVTDFFVEDTTDALTFAHAIGTQMSRYPRQVTEVSFNLLDSHDTARALTLAKGNKDRLKLAVTFQMTYSGTPCIYYGDEFGMEGDNDPDCRRCMIWDEKDQDLELFAFYQQLIALRKQYPALRQGTFKFLHAKEGNNGLIYERSDDKDTFVIAMNSSSEPVTVSIDVKTTQWENMLDHTTLHVENGRLEEQLPAFAFVILKAVQS
ncbi:alpha-glycosidase [Paenibacillus sp. PK4536]|uniref:alpha-glycosidase n=1 Tax=Paenibacillus sp. PK4536 TaxID=3024576 RepID=UPI00235996F1|nr:alpha-glycosidase [Paenibacillus sp. PK4536]WIM40703.1 alpha-glycosidase [Paenibacillus sp. PK4536]